MVGICAGLPGKANLGDVIFGYPTWDYQSGKRLRDEGTPVFAFDPHQLSVPESIKARMEDLRTDNATWNGIRERWVNPPKEALRLLIGPLASGSAVLADEAAIADVTSQKRSLLGVEMEAYGVYAAAASASFPRPTAFALKSVCDFGDSAKDDTMQAYAAHTSANALGTFMEKYIGEIVPLAGS